MPITTPTALNLCSNSSARLQTMRRAVDFKRTFNSGSRVSSGDGLIILVQSETKGLVGWTLSGKVANSVRRSFVKRRLREYFLNGEIMAGDFSFNVLIRKNLGEMSKLEISNWLDVNLKKAVERLKKLPRVAQRDLL